MSYPCDRCDGMREVYVHNIISKHAYTTAYVACPNCDGTGRQDVPNACWNCGQRVDVCGGCVEDEDDE